MDEYPEDLITLMDELSSVDFCKLAFYKLTKMKIETIQELVELEKVMCKAMDLSTKMKLSMLSPALRERFYQVVAEKGLDKPPSLLANIARDYLKMPSHVRQKSPIFLKENQPKLCNVDPNSYKGSQKPGLIRIKTERISPPRNRNKEGDLYKSQMLQLDTIKQERGKDAGRRIPHKSIKRESPNPLRAYRSKPKRSSTPPRAYRSPSPPPYKRVSSRPRRSPSEGAYSRRSPPSPRSYSARRASPVRRSRSPPSTRAFLRRSRSPPSTRAFYKKSRSPPSVREVPKDDDEEGVIRKSGLSFSLVARKKVPQLEKPPFMF